VTPAATSTAQTQTQTQTFSESHPETQTAPKVTLHTIKVPTLPPLSASQADTWTKTLWPVVYNPAAARATVAPPVQVLARTREFIQPDAGRYLAFARKVAHEALHSGRGRGVGAVVVDPEIVDRILDAGGDIEERWADAIVAVAGDARYSRREAGKRSVAEKHSGPGPNPAVDGYDADVEGGPDLHALMRAAEIIAYKRRVSDPDAESDRPDLSALEEYFIAQLDSTAPEPKQDTDTDTPTPVPEKYQKTGLHESQAVPITSSTSTSAPQESSSIPGASLRIRPRTQGGYLCTDLDVYLTHEPCVCCCMALLLSRFRSVTYPQTGRMVSGGLASEPVIQPVPVSEPDNGAENEEGKANEANSKQPRQYYGLHWRKELNWRALGFEFVQDGQNQDEDIAEDGVAFYA
jgi:tRNA-specific adenosine deaminase 3